MNFRVTILIILGVLSAVVSKASCDDAEEKYYEQLIRQVSWSKRIFKLPDERTIKSIFCDCRMNDFTERTSILTALAGQSRKEVGIYLELELSCLEYFKFLKGELEENSFKVTQAPGDKRGPLLIEKDGLEKNLFKMKQTNINMKKSILIEKIIEASEER